MDRSRRINRATARPLVGLGAACALGLGSLGLFPSREARAEWPTIPATTMTWAEAADQTRSQGKPTVVIVTSRTVPLSAQVARGILGSRAVARFRSRVNVVEMSAEDEPQQIKRAQITGYPTFIALRRNVEGTLEVAGSFRGAFSPEELAGWIRGLGLLDGAGEPVATATSTDRGVVRAGLLDRGQTRGAPPNPSPQAPAMYPPSPPKAPPAQPYCPPPYTPPPVYAPPPSAPPEEVYVEQPVVEREVVIEEQPAERELVLEEQPVEVVVAQPRQVVVAQPRQVVMAQPRQVVVAQPREAAAPRNVLTRPPTTREANPPTTVLRTVSAPRTVVLREAAPAPRTVVLREAAPAPRTVVLREAAPRAAVVRAAPREAAVAAPRAAVAAQPALIQPGPLSRAIGRIGSRVATLGLPRVEVETQTTYRLAPARETSVVAEAAPRPAFPQQPAQPTYAAPPPAYYPPPVYYPPAPPWAPTPQQPAPPSPQGP